MLIATNNAADRDQLFNTMLSDESMMGAFTQAGPDLSRALFDATIDNFNATAKEVDGIRTEPNRRQLRRAVSKQVRQDERYGSLLLTFVIWTTLGTIISWLVQKWLERHWG